MKKTLALIFLSAGSFFASSEALAQSLGYANEALMLSRYGIYGTARTTAMGGAQTALGADMGGIFLNPAGLGIFNSSEISLSPTLRVSGNDAQYLGNSSFNDKTNFHLGNIGAVFGQRKKDETTGWLGGSFGVSYQQLVNFSDRFSYEGSNAEHGLINRFVDFFETSQNDLLTDLAYETFLVGDYYYIDEDGAEVGFSTPAFLPDLEYPVMQRETVTRSGNVSAITLAYGGNISDKIYIGAGANMTGVNLRTEKMYTEIFQPSDDVPRFSVNEIQELTGGGVNFSFGVIGRPLPFVRVGLSYHTPTYYSLSEQYNTQLDVEYNNFPINQDNVFLEGYTGTDVLTRGFQENINDYDFQLRTPSRLNLGAAVFIGKAGFISTDVEFVNYGGAKLTDDSNFLQADNRAISNDYGSAVNIRTGGEFRYDILRLRAGFAYQGDPYKNLNTWDRSIQTLSAGAGLKFQKYYIDLAIANQNGNQYYTPYVPARPEQRTNYAQIENTITTGMLTLGLTF